MALFTTGTIGSPPLLQQLYNTEQAVGAEFLLINKHDIRTWYVQLNTLL